VRKPLLCQQCRLNMTTKVIVDSRGRKSPRCQSCLDKRKPPGPKPKEEEAK
jgi:DTW domain-containing protein YfiP